MADFFLQYGLFALKTLTVCALVGVLLAVSIGMLSRASGHETERFEITKLDKRLEHERELLSGALLDDDAYRHSQKAKKVLRKKQRKARKKELSSANRSAGVSTDPRRHVFVVDFDGDIAATAVSGLRREVSAILSLTDPVSEVVVRLESSGGLVHSYGLAASQLARIRTRGIKLTVCVDKVAASGGYMMAAVADKILAAPFAIVGSIGVVAQLPNFHRLLKKHHVDFELLTAGEFKRTLTVFGENTPDKRERLQQELESTHVLFKEFLSEQRPQVDVSDVATGEVWFGKRALEKKLVDEISTSDEYLSHLCADADVLQLKFEKKKSLQDKLTSSLETAADNVLSRVWQRATDRNPS